MGEISIKVSEDQNTITLDDGTVLVAKDTYKGMGGCNGCINQYENMSNCSGMPCVDRKDGKNKIFIKEPAND